MSCDFDLYADTYDAELRNATAFAGRDPAVFTEAKATALIRLARAHLSDLTSAVALDVGCGVGNIHDALEPHFAALHGIDISARALDVARAQHPQVEYRTYAGTEFPFETGTFDFVFTICVVHHVPPNEWPRFVREMARVARPGGVVAIVEHNALNPLTRLVTVRCAFDEGITLVPRRRAQQLLTDAGLAEVASDYILFSPWRGAKIEGVERHLKRLPLGAQYMTYGKVE